MAGPMTVRDLNRVNGEISDLKRRVEALEKASRPEPKKADERPSISHAPEKPIASGFIPR